MTLLTSIQGRIENKIFTRLGSTVVRTPFVSSSTDKWGDATTTYNSNENVTAVPYSYIDKRTDFQPFGDLQKGEVIMAFKQDQSLDEKDKITFDSTTFLIRSVEKFPLADGVIVKVARMVEEV